MITIDINPNLLQIGPFLLTWHGFFSAVGLFFGIWVAVIGAARNPWMRVSEDEVYATAIWGTIAAVIGARLFHVVDNLESYASNPIAILAINEGGIAIWGAIVGGITGGVVYALIKRHPIAALADIAAPGLIFGQAVGRLGDVINGEHHADPTSLPFGVRYIHPQTLGQSEPVHLAVGYELLLDLGIFVFLVTALERWVGTGVRMWAYLILYSIGRFLISYTRYDNIIFLGLRQAQLVAVATVLVAVAVLLWQWRTNRLVPEHAAA